MSITVSVFICVFILGLSAACFADEVSIIATVGDRTTKFVAKPKGKGYSITFDCSELGLMEKPLSAKNFAWMKTRLTEISKMAESKKACGRDRTQGNINNDQTTVVHVDLCLLEKNERSKAMREYINTITSSF